MVPAREKADKSAAIPCVDSCFTPAPPGNSNSLTASPAAAHTCSSWSCRSPAAAGAGAAVLRSPRAPPDVSLTDTLSVLFGERAAVAATSDARAESMTASR